ncbi:riboflavin biosynthesis protein VVA0006-like [Liolophura sinensis]|uniref:riboflavin biosynthesis protein VVA0006-like n=1 Tax=Liolophura sinensis TaxID=3198878 RepID=UPI0031590054
MLCGATKLYCFRFFIYSQRFNRADTFARLSCRSMAAKKVKTEIVADSEEKFTPFYSKASPFSQHHFCEFEIDGMRFNCAEQYMMYQKAVLFQDNEMARKIMASKDPVEQKRFGRNVKNFDQAKWNEVCEDIVRKANKEKFTQNQELKQALLATRGTTLVEASPRDRKWGVGLGVNNEGVHSRKKWRGKNLLGQILTSVRDEIEMKEKSAIN